MPSRTSNATSNGIWSPHDHVVVFGHVRSVCERDGDPLAFHGGRFADLADRADEPVHWFF